MVLLPCLHNDGINKETLGEGLVVLVVGDEQAHVVVTAHQTALPVRGAVPRAADGDHVS